jgi:hypothetical protein
MQRGLVRCDGLEQGVYTLEYELQRRRVDVRVQLDVLLHALP